MLSRTMFTIEYIHQLRENTGYDPQLLERVIYAFGLLEAIRKVELPFCFKGGTSARFGITERTLRYDGAERSLKMEQY